MPAGVQWKAMVQGLCCPAEPPPCSPRTARVEQLRDPWQAKVGECRQDVLPVRICGGNRGLRQGAFFRRRAWGGRVASEGSNKERSPRKPMGQ